MKIIFVGCLIVFATLSVPVSAADAIPEQNLQKPKFVVCAPDKDSNLRSSLYRVLRGNGEVARFDKANTIDQALDSEAEVLVLILTGKTLPELEEDTVRKLRQRKIIGFGFGAALLFGRLGLEINSGSCEIGGSTHLRVKTSELLGESKNTGPVQVFRERTEPGARPHPTDTFEIFLPPGENSSVVDVIARWTGPANYAPIVRQGNCVFIGIPLPSTQWTEQSTDLIRATSQALYERQREEFSVARQEITKAGDYEFVLAKQGSTDQPFSKTFYFRFTEPKRVIAHLEDSTTEGVVVDFLERDHENGCDKHMDCLRSRNKNILDLTAFVSRGDIAYWGDHHLKLRLRTRAGEANCKLKITIEDWMKE